MCQLGTQGERNEEVSQDKKSGEKDARVKAVVPNHMEPILRKTTLILQHVVEVLWVTEGEQGVSIKSSNGRQSMVVARQGERRTFHPLTSSCPQLNITLSNPQWGSYIPHSVEYTRCFESGFSLNVSG